MTLSMKLALDEINKKQGSISYHELGFFLTVLRDNAEEKEVYEFLNQVLKTMKI